MFELVDAQAALGEAFGVPVDLCTLPPPGDRLRAEIDARGVRLL